MDQNILVALIVVVVLVVGVLAYWMLRRRAVSADYPHSEFAPGTGPTHPPVEPTRYFGPTGPGPYGVTGPTGPLY